MLQRANTNKKVKIMPQVERSSFDEKSELSREIQAEFEGDEESKNGDGCKQGILKMGFTFGGVFGAAMNSKATENDEGTAEM